MQNQVYIQADWGLFVGKFQDNVLHKHYALQLSVAANKPFFVTDKEGNKTAYHSCFITSNTPHQFQSDAPSLILLINPISRIGHQLHQSYQQGSIVDLDQEWMTVRDVFGAFIQEQISFTEMIAKLKVFLNEFKCACEAKHHLEDDRIYKAIHYLEMHADRVVPLKEIAAQCFLSETRFLHVFKEQTGLNFRRYQLWNKLIQSLPTLSQQTITETAHQFGFTDSSHYNRSFKETFGLTPKILSQLK